MTDDKKTSPYFTRIFPYLSIAMETEAHWVRILTACPFLFPRMQKHLFMKSIESFGGPRFTVKNRQERQYFYHVMVQYSTTRFDGK